MAGCYLAGETGLRAARLPLLTPTRALTEQSERRVGRGSLVPATSRGSACARSSCCEGSFVGGTIAGGVGVGVVETEVQLVRIPKRQRETSRIFLGRLLPR